jgi:hypothetical protein
MKQQLKQAFGLTISFSFRCFCQVYHWKKSKTNYVDSLQKIMPVERDVVEISTHPMQSELLLK